VPLEQAILKRRHLISPYDLLSRLETILRHLNIKFHREKEISLVTTAIRQQEEFQKMQEERKLRDKEQQERLALERKKKLAWLKSVIPNLG
jgi:predicted DNA binding protein